MSPSERSITFGISSFSTNWDASRYPAEPGWIFEFPDCVSSNGSHPTSSSDPEHTTRSAERTRAMRLGLASRRCGSCSAVVAEYTLILSPPISFAREPHSGSHTNTLTAAIAGSAASVTPSTDRLLSIDFMDSPQNLCAPWAPRLMMYWRKTWLSGRPNCERSRAYCNRTRLNSLGLQSTMNVFRDGLYAFRIGKFAALKRPEFTNPMLVVPALRRS